MAIHDADQQMNSGRDISRQMHTHPNETSKEAHDRAKYYENELHQLDTKHETSELEYTQRREQIVTMIQMAHSQIEAFDRVYGPQGKQMPADVPHPR